jgi:CIC family chloride channel protein
MISNSIAYVISRRFQPVPIFEVLSHQDGVVMPSMEEAREAQLPRVEDAMRSPVVVLPGDLTVADALAAIPAESDVHVPVALSGASWASVSRAELTALEQAGRGSEILSATIAEDRRLATVHRDQPLETALRLLGTSPLLPVVHRADPRRLEGVVTLDDILAVYRESGH